MKVICNNKALAEALTIISGVVARRTPTPVLTVFGSLPKMAGCPWLRPIPKPPSAM